MTHPYFKMHWVPALLADQQSRLKSLLIAAARNMSAGLPNASAQSANTDNDYFAFTDPGDTEVLQFLDHNKRMWQF